MIDFSKKVVPIKANEQFQYLDRWVNKENFRTFVYNLKGDQKLANSYKEYEALISSGIWFDEKPAPKERKRKYDTLRSDG